MTHTHFSFDSISYRGQARSAIERRLSFSRVMLLQVLIIGIACTMHDWTPRLLRALAVDREVIIYDNAGIGQSAILPGFSPTPASYFRFQADTLAGLISQLGLDRPDVLGWCAHVLLFFL